jgi:phage nucleotide-binding protein
MVPNNPTILGEEKKAPTPAPMSVTDDILSRIMAKVSKPEITTSKLKVMIYGEPGVGKTHWAASSPRCLLIDVERGARTLIGKNVDVLEYVNIEQIEATIRLAKEGNTAFDKYDTFAFDSLSEMQRRLLDAQLLRIGKETGTPIYKADWDVWGVNTQRLRSLMSAFRDIDKNLIVTAQAKQEKDDSTGIIRWRPDLTPKLAATVAGLFDVVGYLRINSQGERILQVQPSKTVLAKTRIVLPKEILNPTWDSINK